MLPYPVIDPVAFSIGPLKIHWYGLAYLVAFICVWRLALYRSRKPWVQVAPEKIEDLVFYCAIGVIAGGRMGYVFFYQFATFLDNPLWLFKLWEGGMSFHGGLLGVTIAMLIFSYRNRLSPLGLGDLAAPLVPIGLLLGRLANFVGQELWGRETDGWWGMQFPDDALGLVRHPSQLYEAFLEGIVMFVILFWFSTKPRPRGLLSGMFLCLYATFRFIVEFAREPDAHITEQLLGWMTRGQLLCIPMFLVGFAFILYALKYGERYKMTASSQ